MNIVYDIETYPNVFTMAAEHCEYPLKWSFEISPWRNDSRAIIEFMYWITSINGRMIGFNNVGFDYPVLHLLTKLGNASAHDLYVKAMQIIQSEDKFTHLVYPSDRVTPQIDLFKIHHFDNKARATSLKALEFNMRMHNIHDLPFPVGTTLNQEQTAILKAYNAHDVSATVQFYHKTKDMIRFREDLTKTHGKDFMNHSDVKIGKEIFQIELEKSGVQCYEYGQNGRQPKQTKRSKIALKDCVPNWVQLEHPEFVRIRDWFMGQTITETKGAFKDVTAQVAGLEFVFGTGGLHASVENEYFQSNEDMTILDIDVTGLYPSIAIVNELYPQHLGATFVAVYKYMKAQRAHYKKGTPENAMYKLAMNGVYGASNDKFSIFYDPLFTMRITIGGQLMIAMLAERLDGVEGVSIIQVNTDGITMYLPKDKMDEVNTVCQTWEKLTRLDLERVEYDRMAIRDVNNYIALKYNGDVKRKGAYEYDIEWHQDGGELVIPKVAEQVLIYGKPLRKTLEEWPDKLDFMSRVKVPRGSRLVMCQDGEDIPLENTQRFYVSKGGGHLFKIMPPLAKSPDKWRRLGVKSGWTVCPCNDLDDAVLDINFEYYVQEIEKLVLGVI